MERRVIDMTIDEAIAMMHEWADYECYNEEQIQASEAFNQIAVLLEELKAYRENSNGYNKEDIELNRNAAYNKAIDDFTAKLCDHCMQQTNECYKLECPFCTDGCDIVNIAEQLKVDCKNDGKE